MPDSQRFIQVRFNEENHCCAPRNPMIKISNRNSINFRAQTTKKNQKDSNSISHSVVGNVSERPTKVEN